MGRLERNGAFDLSLRRSLTLVRAVGVPTSILMEEIVSHRACRGALT